MKKVRSIKGFFTKFMGRFIAFLYLKWSGSWCRDEEEITRLDRLIDEENGVILVFWHGKFLPLFALLEGHDATVFTSDCFRGEIISQICHRFGYKPSLIPPTGGGSKYRHMHRVLKSTRIGAFAVDGPLGPNHETKPGVIKMASSLGYLIVPISMSCDSKRVMNKRWDNRELPHWGSSVSLAIGDPIFVPSGLRTQDLEEWCEKVTAAINEVDLRAEARMEDITMFL